MRDEVTELAKRNTMAVVSPLRWRPPIPLRTAQPERSVPIWATEAGVQVVRPRVPAIPLGGLFVESRLWASRLERLLRHVYREIDGDLVHAHFALPDGFAAARYSARTHVPFVLTIWGSDVMEFGSRRLLHGTLRWTFDEARAIVAVSQELADRAEWLGAQSERIRVIPGGVPYSRSVPRDEARARVGVAGDALCLLWIGGLVPVKQPLQAIQAFEYLARSSTRETLLVMIGDGPLRRDVRDFVRRKELDRTVHLLGHCAREHVWTWQCAADVLINSSRSEGTPLAVLEALGAGTPVVGYPVGGVSAALAAVDGGRLAAEKTPRALAAAIADELAGDRKRERLAEDAQAQFHIAVTGRAIEDVYDAVV